MSTVTFSDVVTESLVFSKTDPADQLILKLIDTPWVQRLRDISQTANTRLVFMFSEHSRFGHCLGVAYLAKILMDKLYQQFGEVIAPYRLAVSAASLLHDIGHLAPGSHTAYRTWFPNNEDQHENIAKKIILEDSVLRATLEEFHPKLPELVCAIIEESKQLPPWTWEILSGGGWNVDRGNWCIVDSIMGGVSYGKYNVLALTDSITLTKDQHLALRENRLDAMMHFAVSRHAMYRQIYQHRVLLAADTINMALAQRARDLSHAIPFADLTMRAVLDAKNPMDLDLKHVFNMRESWWRYHVSMWQQGKDSIMADLANRLLNRRLFKTVRIREGENPDELKKLAARAVEEAGYDPKYYLHQISTSDTLTGDFHQSMLVQMDDGRLLNLSEAEPLFGSLLKEAKASVKHWLSMPEEAKILLGRER